MFKVISIINYATIFLIAFYFTSCQRLQFSDESDTGLDNVVSLNFSLSAPSLTRSTFVARSSPSYLDSEEDIKTIYVFLFRNNGLSDVVVQSKKVDVNTSGEGVKKFNISFLINSSDINFKHYCHLFANVESLPADYVGKTYDELQALINNNITPLGDNVVSDGFTMWGKSEFFYPRDKNFDLTIHMLRSVARVDVGIGQYGTDAIPDGWNSLDAAGATIPFKLKNIYIYNATDQYAISPVLDNITEGLGSVIANVPSTVGTKIGLEEWVYTNPTPANNYMVGNVYIPEADVFVAPGGTSNDDNHTNRCAIVIGGDYTDTDGTVITGCYYRADFRKGTSLKNVLRNTLYRLSIISVNGRGATTPDDAYNGVTTNINVVLETILWNEEELDHIIVDGKNWVKIDTKKVLLAGLKGATDHVGISSSVDVASWSMSFNDVDFTIEPSLDNGVFKVTKPTASAGGSLKIEALTSLTDANKSATLTIKINSIKLVIDIEQLLTKDPGWEDGENFPVDM